MGSSSSVVFWMGAEDCNYPSKPIKSPSCLNNIQIRPVISSLGDISLQRKEIAKQSLGLQMDYFLRVVLR